MTLDVLQAVCLVHGACDNDHCAGTLSKSIWYFKLIHAYIKAWLAWLYGDFQNSMKVSPMTPQLMNNKRSQQVQDM